jgi:hypothetical protein
MAKRRSRRERKAHYVGRIPLPPKPEQVIVPKPKRSDRAAERQRLKRVSRDPEAE